ncbi:glycosyltransferase [Proteiniphilum sp. UBA5384]|uniref:glycosyltransferase n=1 Tax=Proteiniphilum sp. UBA5384 TaxID=1947279 RepID=UPI0025F65ADE|nr:glycosyltransferase [Proteiniphilum sp. UBA5384]
MNILLNFFPVQSGGGQQVASNFLITIMNNNYNHNWFVYVGENSELHILANQILPKSNLLITKYSYIERLTNKKKVDEFIDNNGIDLIYNYAPILQTRKKIPQIVRSVYSNLYFPEVNFWKGYSPIIRLKKNIIDKLRLQGTLKANGLIFENKSMQVRASELFNYPTEKTFYIEPSVTLFDESLTSPSYGYLKEDESFKILYLSSWHLNKNIHILPHVAAILKKRNIMVKFILSLNINDTAIQKKLVNVINNFQVNEYFTFIGKVPAKYVHQVIKYSNAMILLSKLECFSSNIIEAFYFQRPLIIADEPWAKSECKDAVLYVQRDNILDIVNNIETLKSDKNLYDDLISKGHKRLNEFNTPEKKVTKQVEFIEKIYNEIES